MDDPEVVERFFGVYLLYCRNPKYKGKTYIGYTVNPMRRIKQHNAGKNHGGAWKTSQRGPWDMVLIIHGFPNSTSALRFEWAWQHPHISRRLKHIPNIKNVKRKTIKVCLTVLSEMLKVGPWNRLPLTIRWINYEFSKDYKDTITAPLHMPICYGKVTSRRTARDKQVNDIEIPASQVVYDSSLIFCSLCGVIVEEKEMVCCVKPGCLLIAHLVCLAKEICGDMILPVEGTCPACNTNILWGDIIRKKLGCDQDSENCSNSDSDVSD